MYSETCVVQKRLQGQMCSVVTAPVAAAGCAAHFGSTAQRVALDNAAA
jgi:hypothetical protein